MSDILCRRFKVDISLLEKEVHRRCDLSSEEIFEVRRLLLELQSTLSRFGFNDDKLFRKLFDCIDSVISLVHREVEVDADERPHRHEPVEPAAVGAENDVISLLNPPDPSKKEKAKWRFKRSPIKRRSPDRPMTSTESVRTTTAPPLVQPCTTRQRSSTVQPVLNEARPKAMGIFTTEKENVETLLNRTASSDILKQYLVSSPADDDRVRNNPAASVDDQTSTKYDPPEKDGSRQAESLQQLSILKEAVTGLRQVVRKLFRMVIIIIFDEMLLSIQQSQSSICEKLGRIQSELSEQKKSTEQLLRQNRVLVENITESSKRNIQSSTLHLLLRLNNTCITSIVLPQCGNSRSIVAAKLMLILLKRSRRRTAVEEQWTRMSLMETLRLSMRR